MHPNTMLHNKTWFYGPVGWIRCVRCEKLQSDFVAQTFALIALVHPVLLRVSCSYEAIPNAPKHYATHQNMSLRSNGADWVRSLRKIPMHQNMSLRSNGADWVCSLWKIPTWLRGTNFYINCTSSHRFAPSAVTKPYQMHPNTMKRSKTWIYGQWDASSVFVAKNYNLTSWHELLH